MGTKSVLPTITNRLFLYPRNKSFLAVLILLCLILNSSIPGFFVTAFNYSQFEKAIKFQSAVSEYFSFTAIPIKILGSMFQDGAVNSSQKSERKTSPTANMSLANIGVNQITGKYSGQRIWNSGQASYPITFASLFASSKLNCSDPPVSPGALLSIVLICFFLLPRSSVSDAYASILNRVLGGTRLDRSSRVFYFPIETHFLYFPDNNEYKYFSSYTRKHINCSLGGCNEKN